MVNCLRMTNQTTITKPTGGTRPALYRIGTCAKSATTYGSEGEIVEAGSYAEAIAIAESRWPLDPDGDEAVFAAQAPDAQDASEALQLARGTK